MYNNVFLQWSVENNSILIYNFLEKKNQKTYKIIFSTGNTNTHNNVLNVNFPDLKYFPKTLLEHIFYTSQKNVF